MNRADSGEFNRKSKLVSYNKFYKGIWKGKYEKGYFRSWDLQKASPALFVGLCELFALCWAAMVQFKTQKDLEGPKVPKYLED